MAAVIVIELAAALWQWYELYAMLRELYGMAGIPRDVQFWREWSAWLPAGLYLIAAGGVIMCFWMAREHRRPRAAIRLSVGLLAYLVIVKVFDTIVLGYLV